MCASGAAVCMQDPSQGFDCRFNGPTPGALDPGYQACVVRISALLKFCKDCAGRRCDGLRHAGCLVQDATRKSLITATAASSMLGCIIMGASTLSVTHWTYERVWRVWRMLHRDRSEASKVSG